MRARRRVPAQLVEGIGDFRDPVRVEVISQLLVKRGRCLPAGVEEGQTRVGQLDLVLAAVVWLTLPQQQPCPLHAVEVVGQGGAVNSDDGCEFALVATAASISTASRVSHTEVVPPTLANASSNARSITRAERVRSRPSGGPKGAGMSKL